MTTEKSQTLTALRGKILADTLNNTGMNRFGMFSFPPAGVWGDGNYTFEKSKKLGQDGKPITKPRGIFSHPTSTGKTPSSYFSDIGYTTVGDKYIDPASIERKYQLSKKKNNHHESEFKPADGTKSDPFTIPYKHMTDHTETKKNYRGADGKVQCQPRNIVTNPAKKGHGDSTIGHLIDGKHKHLPEPYDRRRELEAKEREEHKKKLQEQPFRSASHGGHNFAADKLTFGKDGKILPAAKPKPESAAAKKLHEAPFKPSNPSKEVKIVEVYQS
jgi:hypothetical protein